MPHDKNLSPVGWYVVSYLLRFVALRDKNNNDDERRFHSWENTILVQADHMDHAYDKAIQIGKKATGRYKGGPEGVPVQWKFVGITEILPIYEDIGDGAEILWAKRAPRKLRTLKQMVKPKGGFRQ